MSQICSRCVMDTTDPEITFADNGHCSHCRMVEETLFPEWDPNVHNTDALGSMAKTIKEQKRGNYDSIIGLSGGIDSSYLAHIAKKEMGLNPLAVHVDAGWNSDEAVSNIESLTTKLGIDLVTIVVDWEDMKDLHLAFLKAGVPNQDIPQDHVFFAGLYSYAVKNGIQYVLNGSNWATESILPKAWGYNAMDAKHLKAVHKRFGSRKLRKFPIVSFFSYYFYYPYIRRMKIVRPLNEIAYNKDEAIQLLQTQYGWKAYGQKHMESRFTKFFQSYYLPTKFGYDKRKAHLSSLIMAGAITREQAMAELEKLPYDQATIEEDLEFVAKKLGLSVDGLQGLITAPNHEHAEYPSNVKLHGFLKNMRKMVLGY